MPQIVLGTNLKTMPNLMTMADLKGKKIGVTALGSWTHLMVNFVLAKVGLKPSDISIIGGSAPQGFIDKNPATVHALASIVPEIAAAKLELAAVWTNDFAKKANPRYPKG